MVGGSGMRFIKGHGFKGKHQTEEAKASIRAKMRGELNVHWKGDSIKVDSGRTRAQNWYKLGKCELCERDATDRHHKDGNTLNNESTNIQILCRKHHIILDGRMKNLKPFMNGGYIPIETAA
jgi:hypothetical protein